MPGNLKPGDWTIRLRDGSLIVAQPNPKQTLQLLQASGGGEPQSIPLDTLTGLRLLADGKRTQIESMEKVSWLAEAEDDPFKAILKFQSRLGEISLPLSAFREVSVTGSAEQAEGLDPNAGK